MSTSEADLYHVLYPAGWCIVPSMEVTHHQLWSEIVRETVHLDSLGRLLVQLIVMFQVDGVQRNKDCNNREDLGYREREEVCFVISTQLKFLKNDTFIVMIQSYKSHFNLICFITTKLDATIGYI